MLTFTIHCNGTPLITQVYSSRTTIQLGSKRAATSPNLSNSQMLSTKSPYICPWQTLTLATCGRRLAPPLRLTPRAFAHPVLCLLHAPCTMPLHPFNKQRPQVALLHRHAT